MKYRTNKIIIPAGDTRLKLLILTPRDKKENHDSVCSRTGVLWIHGGGYVTGMASMVYMSRAKDLVRKYGSVVISPAYRLAGKAPYPAALEDCHHALLYLREHAEELGVRSDQIMVGGESAGGGLAAALCMYEKDKGGVRISFQMPLYPMIDCEDTETSRDNHAPVWNTKRNHYGWRKYLSGITDKQVPCYASAARRNDYTGLSPVYTFVSTAEPFYAETMTYIDRLKKAGVEAQVDVYPGLFHAFDMLCPFLKVSRQAAARFEARFVYAQKHYFAEQNGRQ
ncbi:MAG: alpha/beta hydrolase [Eubacteriales bacterium]|nr:alpha/beta hydrolase [Eubacteriales bacterium]